VICELEKKNTFIYLKYIRPIVFGKL